MVVVVCVGGRIVRERSGSDPRRSLSSSVEEGFVLPIRTLFNEGLRLGVRKRKFKGIGRDL